VYFFTGLFAAAKKPPMLPTALLYSRSRRCCRCTEHPHINLIKLTKRRKILEVNLFIYLEEGVTTKALAIEQGLLLLHVYYIYKLVQPHTELLLSTCEPITNLGLTKAFS
jgi:hypothetical protein